MEQPPLRPAIISYQPALCTDPQAETAMRALAARLDFAVVGVFPIDPRTRGPWTVVSNALGETGADAVITVDLEHVDGIDKLIHERAQLITLAGERVLERSAARADA